MEILLHRLDISNRFGALNFILEVNHRYIYNLSDK